MAKLAIVYVRQSSPGQVLNNTGSTAAQRALAERAREWGWPDDRILIAEDLGLSGRSVTDRLAFQDLLARMDRGEVGLVMVCDTSRLGRDPLITETFFTAAIRAGILLESNGQLIDTGTAPLGTLFAQRVQLLFGWLEIQMRVERFMAAKLAKVAQGLAVSRPPIGYVRSVRGHWVKDPDPSVREAIDSIYRLYRQSGSIGLVFRYMRQHGLRFPKRVRGELVWNSVVRNNVVLTLKNPHYTGQYIAQQFRAIPGTGRSVRRPASEWRVIPAHHDGYLPREEFERVQILLASRRATVRPPAGKGRALLQGLVSCGACQRPMATKHQGRDQGHRVASYACEHRDRWEQPLHRRCHCSATLVDDAIVSAVHAALAPPTLESALSAIEEVQEERDRLDRTQARLLQQADDEVEEARRRHQLVAPENRRVKADLEARWEDALRRRDELRRHQAASRAKVPVGITAAQATELVALATDLPALWNAPTTSPADRKELLRAVIEHVEIQSATPEAIEAAIIWKGGLRESVRALRPPGVNQALKELRQQRLNAPAIAARLRDSGFKTARGAPMSVAAVQQRLGRLGLSDKAAYAQALPIIRARLLEGLSQKRILISFHAENPTPWIHWTKDRLQRAVRLLRQGVAGIAPLPPISTAETKKRAAIQHMARRRQAGTDWATIADELNAMGFQPQRTARFSAQIVHWLSRSWCRRQAEASRQEAVSGESDPTGGRVGADDTLTPTSASSPNP